VPFLAYVRLMELRSRVYRSVGFAGTETQLQAARVPRS
jgi:hypothetical protein